MKQFKQGARTSQTEDLNHMSDQPKVLNVFNFKALYIKMKENINQPNFAKKGPISPFVIKHKLFMFFSNY